MLRKDQMLLRKQKEALCSNSGFAKILLWGLSSWGTPPVTEGPPPGPIWIFSLYLPYHLKGRVTKGGWERKKKRKRIFHLLIHSSDYCSSKDKVRPKSGVWNSMHVSCTDVGTQAPASSLRVFPGALTQSWIRGGAGRIQIEANMGCQGLPMFTKCQSQGPSSKFPSHPNGSSFAAFNIWDLWGYL